MTSVGTDSTSLDNNNKRTMSIRSRRTTRTKSPLPMRVSVPKLRQSKKGNQNENDTNKAQSSTSTTTSTSTSSAVDTITLSNEYENEFEPTFEIIVLGSGGGPLETDCSGYLVKASKSSWEDGVLALEGGSGLGALASILSNPITSSSNLFPDLQFPKNYNTPLLQAAHVFSFLACYLITHAHLDHVGSLIMLSGSVPPKSAQHTQPPTDTNNASPHKSNNQTKAATAAAATHPKPHVYGTRKTLEQLSQAYQGGLWPELGSWVPDREGDRPHHSGRKKRKIDGAGDSGKNGLGLVNGPNGEVEGTEENYNSCLLFSPLSTERVHRPLHPTLPISLLTYPVAHGCTSKNTYESSAMFIRYDPSALTQTPPSSSSHSSSSTTKGKGKGKEFLFFGDVESSYRNSGEEDIDIERGKEAKRLNEHIWKEASKSFKDGRLCGIFIECSYDSSRPAHLMFGHLSPPGLYQELKTLAGFVSKSKKRPLEGLKIFIIHIKDALVPHPTGKTAREIIMSELNDLENEGGLDVQFIETKRGDRIREYEFVLLRYDKRMG
ncbi:hypothetical protein V865_001369 [Kwoniella europaea PYCC6329]|uniref:Uncharacterized protein n=1 Tax=Kwoniella europaea PYCC6329 TaxID=1423913 RepID=A0AAX4KBV5_9TREE